MNELELQDRPSVAPLGRMASAANSTASSIRKSIFQDEDPAKHMAPDTAQEEFSSAIHSNVNDTAGFAQRIAGKAFSAVKKGMTGTAIVNVPKQVLQQPQIMLEVISGRVAGLIIVLTYLIFALGFGLDCWTTLDELRLDESTPLGVRSCQELLSKNITLANTESSWGCVDTVYTAANPDPTWQAVYADVYDVISVSLLMKESNFTLPASQQEMLQSDINLVYNIDLWACFHPKGCKNDFSVTSDANNNEGSAWQRVLAMDNQVQQLILEPPPEKGTKDSTVSSSFQFFSVFQNQEALPTNSQIQSYYVKVAFLDNLSRLALESASYKKSTTFTLQWDHRSRGTYNIVTTYLQMVFFVLSLVTLAGFVVLVNRFHTHKQKKWLAEQKWFVAYIVAVMIAQNPVYLVQNVMAPDAASALVAFICSFLAQAMFLVIWLLYADSINQYSYDWTWFYLPKVSYGLAVFISSAVMIAYQFPTFTIGSTRSPVLASYNWPVVEKESFVAASITFIALYMFWSLLWIVRLVLTYRQLNALSYMSTRYQQLLFRFFVLQASLVAFYFITQYSIAIYLIGHKQLYDYNSDSLSDGINTLFRQQTQLFGKTMFLTVYSGILGFLLLPAECMDSDIGALVSQHFALDDKELQAILEHRSRGADSQRPNIFCVELALSLLEVSCDSYGDCVSTVKKDLDKSIADMLITHEYAFIDSVIDLEYDCLCVVARHVTKNNLVIAYRGTQSKKNMSDNLNYRKQYVDFEHMPIPELDALDGLEPIKPVPGEVEAPSESREGHQSLFSWSSFPKAKFYNPFASEAKKPDWKQDGSENFQPRMHKATSAGPSNWLDTPAMSRTTSTSSIDMGRQSSRASETSEQTKKGAVTNLLDAIGTGGDKIVDAFKSGGDALLGAAAAVGIDLKTQTVGLHRGFLAIYMSMREGMHAIIRRELKENPGDLYITGHSMGGACASLCALDLTLNTLPRVRAFLDSKKHFAEIKVIMYNFGSPRVGDRNFRKLYNRTCPTCFRVVVDGDVVTGVPKNWMGFKHACVQVLVDPDGFGNMIIGPSFVERWLRLRKGFSVAAHLMSSYRDGLTSVVRTTKLVRELASKFEGRNGDDHATNVLHPNFVKNLITETDESLKLEMAKKAVRRRTEVTGEWATLQTQHGLAGFPLEKPSELTPPPAPPASAAISIPQPELESAISEHRDTFDADATLGVSPRESSVHGRGSMAEFRGSQEFVEAISRGSFDAKMEDVKRSSIGSKVGSLKDRRTMSQDAV